MNLSSLTSLCQKFALDAGGTRFAGQYTDALNLANQQFAYDSKALWKDHTTYTVVDGTAAYDLPSDFWLEKRITHKGLKLDPISRATLDEEYQGTGTDWTAESGTPTHYIIDPEQGRKKLTLFPKPTGGDTGANLILTYYPVPTDMAVDADIPLNSSSLMVQFHIALAAWAAWLLLSGEEATPAKEKQRDRMKELYDNKVSEAVDYFKNTASEPLRMKGGR